MLKRQFVDQDAVVKVTFALPLEATPEPVSVVGDFNGWDPSAHPLRKRTNGTRSVSVTMPVGACYQFKYLAAGGAWFCEDEADAYEVNEFHATNSVLHV